MTTNELTEKEKEKFTAMLNLDISEERINEEINEQRRIKRWIEENGVY